MKEKYASEKAKDVIQLLKNLSDEHGEQIRFLQDIYNCGNAYRPSMEELKKFFTEVERGRVIPKNWERLRKIVRPNFDDSE